MQVHPVGHVSLAAGLNNQQCPATYFTSARPTRSFLYTRTALSVQDQSHKPVVLIYARRQDFLPQTPQNQGAWCVSAPHVRASYGTPSLFLPMENAGKGLFSETQLEKG